MPNMPTATVMQTARRRQAAGYTEMLLMSANRMTPAMQRRAERPWLPLGAIGSFGAQMLIVCRLHYPSIRAALHHLDLARS